MIAIPNERLRERAREKVMGMGLAVTQTAFADSRAELEEELELARIALASLEAKPIGAFHISDQQVGGTTDYIKDGEWPIDDGVIEVYAAPPAPMAVPDEINVLQAANLVLTLGVLDNCIPTVAMKVWNACRAAMLKCKADGNDPVIPDGWVACSEPMLVADDSYDAYRESMLKEAQDDNTAQVEALPAAPQQESE